MTSEIEHQWPKFLTINGTKLQVNLHKRYAVANDGITLEIEYDKTIAPPWTYPDQKVHILCDELIRVIGKIIDCDTPIIMEPITVDRITPPYYDAYTIRGRIPGDDGKGRKNPAQLISDIADRVISSYISHRNSSMTHEEAIETLGRPVEDKVEILRGKKILYTFKSEKETRDAAEFFTRQLEQRGYTVKSGMIKGDVQKSSIIDCLTSDPADPSLLGWGGTLLAEFRVNAAGSTIELQGAGMMPPIIEKIAGEEFALHGGKIPRRIS